MFKFKLFLTLRCVGETSGLVKVTLTFRRRAHHCCLVPMATVTSDKRPAPAFAQTVLIATATQALIMEEAGAGAKLRVLQRCADVTGKTRGGWKYKNKPTTLTCVLFCFVLVVPQTQLPADHAGVSV